jgi:GGDEF domain-containing protein
MPAPDSRGPEDSAKCTVLVCRDPARRALLERIVPAAETHCSAVEAMLAVARKGPRAVVVNLQDVGGAEREMVAAMQRARPDMAVYFVVEPEDEPAGRRLVQAGAGDYFVMPTDVYRLPQALEPPPAPPPQSAVEGEAVRAPGLRSGARPAEASNADLAAGVRTEAAPARERPDQLRLFVSACALADLAQSAPGTILREGAEIILHALDAVRGCLFFPDRTSKSLHFVTGIGAAPEAGPEAFEKERAAAWRAIRANEVLLTEAAPGRAILCVPVRDDAETFAVLCISAKHDGAAPDADDRDAAARLVSVMARLYGAAVRLDRFAGMALRDAETGLLRADALETYLAKLIGRAAAQQAPVTIIRLQPETGGEAAGPAAIARLGRSIAARLPQGWQGARVGGDGFVIVGAPKSAAQPLPQEVALLFAARSEGAAEIGAAGAPRLRAGLAEFPTDGADAPTLLAAAAGRLKAP